MSRYLNAEAKGQLVTILAHKDSAEAVLKEMVAHQGDKAVITALRYAVTYLDKASKAIIEPLDPVEINKLLTYAKKISVAPHYTDKAKAEYKQMMRMDSVLPVDAESFYDLCAQTVEVCRVACHKTAEEQAVCHLRDTMEHLDVPVANDQAEGCCPYKQ